MKTTFIYQVTNSENGHENRSYFRKYDDAKKDIYFWVKVHDTKDGFSIYDTIENKKIKYFCVSLFDKNNTLRQYTIKREILR